MSLILEVNNLTREFSPPLYRMAKALKIKPLIKKYSSKVIKAVDDISFEINSGEICGFLGPNGAGKSTTIKAIVGLIRTNNGKIKIDGKLLSNNRIKIMKNVGGVIENPSMYKKLSGRANLKYFAMIRGGIEDKRIDEVLKIVGLYDRANNKFGEYSMGMRQRLGIAQAILHKPKLLLLDEPANGLDPQGIIELRTLLKSLSREEGVSILVSSHQLSEIQMISDRVIIMNKGKIIAEKSLEELSQSEDGKVKVSFIADKVQEAITFFKEKYNATAILEGNKINVELPKEIVPEATKELLLNSIMISGVEIKENTLEDLFVELTRETHE